MSKVAIAVFVPIYAAFDALAGIGTGTFVQQASQLAPDQSAIFGPVVDAFWNSAWIAATAVVGSIAWTIAMLAASVGLTAPDRCRFVTVLAIIIFFVGSWARSTLVSPDGSIIAATWWFIVLGMGLVMLIAGKPRLPAALLTLARALFGAAHPSPTGPLGMACFLSAATYLELVGQHGVSGQPAVN